MVAKRLSVDSRVFKAEIDGEAAVKVVKIISQFEKHRPTLGLPFAIMGSARLGARFSGLGRAQIVTGRKSWGKGEIIEGTNQDVLGHVFENSDYLSPMWLDERIRIGIEQNDPIKHLSMSFEDLSMMAEEKYHIKNTFNLASWLVSNKKFTRKRRQVLGRPGQTDRAYSFDSVNIVMGCTNRILGSIKRRPAWGSMYSDRMSVFALIRREGDKARVRKAMRVSRRKSSKEMFEIVKRLFPKELPNDIEITAPESQLENMAQVLFGRQHSEGRGIQYLENDLKGLAALAGVTEADSSLCKLLAAFAPYYQMGSLHARDIEICQSIQGVTGLRSISRQTGLKDYNWILERCRYLAKYGFANIVESNGPKSLVEPGWKITLPLSSIDRLM